MKKESDYIEEHWQNVSQSQFSLHAGTGLA